MMHPALETIKWISLHSFCFALSVCVVTGPTSVLAAAGFLVVLTADTRLGAFSATSSSECSVLVSDWSELCWDAASSARDVLVKERAAG